jgi:hypothetical protein
VLITPHKFELQRRDRRPALERGGGNLDRFARGEPLQNVVFQT